MLDYVRNFVRRRKTVALRKITLGICAMDKKARSKPMKEIIARFPEDIFQIVIFGDDCILNQPIESWPVVECLIAFYSNGYPLAKAIQYVDLVHPFLINDLKTQYILQNRRSVYEILQSCQIPVPPHIYVDRTTETNHHIIEEFDEYVVINGNQLKKPFVEKPVDADDHNIYIYYPMSAGGGSKRLFRKTKDRSSEFYPDVNEIRREGSYIYEEFLNTQGTDIKVYTVGANYGHAEARKSPVVDGKVHRNDSGLEVRYPVILSPTEKDITQKITVAFRQIVCGFDLLRVQGQKSYVCDVNGWSFVKNSRKYYDDCARVLCETILLAIRPEYHSILSTVQPLTRNTQQLLEQPAFLRNDSTDTNRQAFEEEEELLCVISVIRHGDRTPKQKMKLLLTDPRYLNFFHANSSSPFANLKVKSKHALTDFLELTKSIIHEGREKCGNMEYFSKLLRIRDVLESHKISGITRKLQMKPTQWSEPIPASSSSPPSPSPAESATETAGMSSSKVELSPNAIRATEVQFILKWGGDLTPLGEEQAEKMGAEFRSFMYPDPSGGGVLRLHSTFRHDLKIKASDEGRVMKTAAAFTKGLLELEGDLTPVLVSLVTVQEKNNQLLDHYDNLEVKKSVDQCKSYLNTVLQMDREFTPEFVNSIAPNATTFTRESLMKLGNPRKTLSQIHDLIKALCVEINGYVILMNKYTEAETEAKPEALSEAETMNQQSLSDSSASSLTTPLADLPPATATLSPTATVSSHPPPLPELYLNESYDLFLDRWEKLQKDFYNKKTGFYDLTKVPEVYDMARYDVIHQDHRLGNSRHILLELFGIVQLFTDCVVPQEYGVNSSDKMKIGRKMCFALLKKIRYDLNVAKSGTQIDLQYLLDLSHGDDLRIKTLGRSVRTRLYFTSESHIYTLLNVLNSTPTIASSALNSVSAFTATPPPPSPLSAAATTTGTGDGEGTGEGEVSTPPPPPSPSPLSDVSTTLSPILSAEGKEEIDKLSELSYLSQITIRLFDNRTLSNDDKNKYRCEISFSPGVFNDPTVEGEHRGEITPPFILNKNIPCDDVIAFLIAATDDNRTPEEEAVVGTGTGKGGDEVNEECCGDGINGDEPSEDL